MAAEIAFWGPFIICLLCAGMMVRCWWLAEHRADIARANAELWRRALEWFCRLDPNTFYWADDGEHKVLIWLDAGGEWNNVREDTLAECVLAAMLEDGAQTY
jgi:hypothetical protein